MTPDNRLATLACKIIFPYLASHKVTTGEVEGLCAAVMTTLTGLDAGSDSIH